MLWAAVLVGVFGIGAVFDLPLQLRVCLFKGVGDVLEKDQTEDDVLVLSSVHVAAQCVGHLPEFRRVVSVATVAGRFLS